MIGTTSTEEKAEIARKAGADHVVLYGEGRDVIGEVYKITGGGASRDRASAPSAGLDRTANQRTELTAPLLGTR